MIYKFSCAMECRMLRNPMDSALRRAFFIYVERGLACPPAGRLVCTRPTLWRCPFNLSPVHDLLPGDMLWVPRQVDAAGQGNTRPHEQWQHSPHSFPWGLGYGCDLRLAKAFKAQEPSEARYPGKTTYISDPVSRITVLTTRVVYIYVYIYRNIYR